MKIWWFYLKLNKRVVDKLSKVRNPVYNASTFYFITDTSTSLHLPLLQITKSTSIKFLSSKTIIVMALETSLSQFTDLQMRLDKLSKNKEQDQCAYLSIWCQKVTSKDEGHPRRRGVVIDISRLIGMFHDETNIS
ncbi:hypothetical protein L1987_84314 [Smallanthus sonchifolius]|uniref:Uncharacterized protein n=1 Tax=Smallanthus sonchifolius TaxID=185202 RepID=A0ACB8YDL1_9ASTR|nr:hypothetical protein L1987_84314 [Smallanthus sonchifolius]